MVKPVPIFISYSHKDNSYLEELLKFLKPDVSTAKISVWTDANILAGQKWDVLIKDNLNRSEIVIFLVSQDFIVSDYINKIEIKIALENSNKIIIPVLVGAIQMEKFVLRSYQILPEGAKPVDQWQPQNKAWVNVVTELDKVINALKENSATDKKVNSTDKIFMSLIIFLFVACIIVFGYGVAIQSNFHIYAGVLGIGISLAGYLFGRKLLAF